MVKTVIDKLMRWREPATLAVLAALLLLALLGVIDLISYSVTSSFLIGAQAAANDFGRPLLSVVFALLVLACLVEPTTERSRRVARSSVLVIGISLAAGVLFALIGYLGQLEFTFFFGYLAERLVTALALLVVFTVGKALPAPEPKAGRAAVSGQQQGQGYPGQNYPGQNYPGQGQQQGQGYPGQNYPGQAQQGQAQQGQGQQGQGQPGPGYPGQNRPGQPGQSQDGPSWSGPTGQGPQDQGGQSYGGQSYGGQSYGGQSYGGQSYGQSYSGPPTSQPSASQNYQPYPDRGQQGGPASAQSAGHPESDQPAEAPRGEWGSAPYSQPPNAFPPPNGPSSPTEFRSSGESGDHQSAQHFGSTQYRDPDEQVRQFGPRRSQSDPASGTAVQSHAAPAGGLSDAPATVTDQGGHHGDGGHEDDQSTAVVDDGPADEQTRTIPAVPDQSGDGHDMWAAPSEEDDHGRPDGPGQG